MGEDAPAPDSMVSPSRSSVLEDELDAGSANGESTAPEVSVVMPCLNEAETVGDCIRTAAAAMREHGIDGEIIVADNGSTDDSRAIARHSGAEVIDVEAKGYGNALMGGIAAARGRFIVMGDADGSYDFSSIPQFVEKLREGFDVVQGCRLPSGGGEVLPGAMPWLHRWWGNPMFSLLAQRMFRTTVHDVYCGLRGFTKRFYGRLDQRCTGMEFATEMIIKASLFGGRVGEIPITLHPDGRTAHLPHLKTFRDGWRTVRLFLICSPRWLFLVPGGVLILLGLIGYAIAMPGLAIGRITFGAHTLLFASMAILCGYQAILFALFSTMFGIHEGLLPPNARLERWFEIVTLEKALVVAIAALVAGAFLLFGAVEQWSSVDFGNLQYARTMRLVVPGVTMAVLGFQTILSSFFVSILGMRRR
jgi:glycosyltransferase involved in cell wall biosynthesis